MIRGSSHCGAVRFEIDQMRALTYCNCANCRKQTGDLRLRRRRQVSLAAGEDMTVLYESAPGSFRHCVAGD